MIRIVSDNDVQGFAQALISRCRQPDWADVWNDLDIEIWSFADLGLAPASNDVEIWNSCQQYDVVLLTGNRNADGPDSLESAIRDANTASSLPVLTIGNLRKLKFDREYFELVAERLMETLIDVETLRGAGRIYLP